MSLDRLYTDVLIIGAGPVGLHAAFHLGMLGIKPLIIDALPFAGGQCMAMYPEKPIYDIPALPSVLAKDLIENLLLQIKDFNIPFLFDSMVDSIVGFSSTSEDKIDRLLIKTKEQTEIECSVVLLSTGKGIFSPNKPNIKEIEEFEGKSVFYSIQDKEIFRDKVVCIAGGGDSAVDWAIELHDIASKIYFIHRRKGLRCHPKSEENLNKITTNVGGKVEMKIPAQVSALHGTFGYLNGLTLTDFDGQEEFISTDFFLPLFGITNANSKSIIEVNTLTDGRIIVDQSNMQSSNPLVFAIGDVAFYKNKLPLISLGFGEAALASREIYRTLHKNDPRFVHSTSSDVFVM